MNHPNCVCGKKGIWKYTCRSGYICICECHPANAVMQEKKELEK